MHSSHPSILIISPSTFNYLNGTGVTLSNLFRNWPNNKLATLHTSNEPEDSSVCSNFFHLGSNIQSPFKKGGVASAIPPSSAASTSHAPASPSRLKKWISGNAGMPKKFVATPALYEWLDKFKPEIIYTTLGPIPMMEAILHIREKYQCKLVIHHMDDWYRDAYSTGIFRYQRKKMLRLFHELLEKSDLRLTIGEKMAEEYKSRFGYDFLPFQNAIEVQNFHEEVAQHSTHQKSEIPVLLYFGSIFPYAQERSLLDTAEVAIQQKSTAFHLRIIAPREHLASFRAKLPSEKNIEFLEISNDKNQFCSEIARASALLLPANFDEETVKMLWLSMPTKLPGYLASGVPILAYSSPILAQTIYTKKYQAACVVDQQNLVLLEKNIIRLVRDSNWRSVLCSNALQLAKQKHDSKMVRSDFQKALLQLGENR